MDEPGSAPGTPGGPLARPAETRHVPAGGITVSAGPDASAAVIAELPAGFEVSVVGRRPPWVHIQTADGLDGWVNGTELAGVAVGAAPVPEPVPVAAEGQGVVAATMRQPVVEKQGSAFLLGTGPVIGAIGGLIAILGTKLPWVQNLNGPESADAFAIPARVLTGWDQIIKGGIELGWVIVILAGIGTLVSLIGGGGIIRRILGFILILISALFILQTQDFLNSAAQGLGTGTNVWDILDFGVLVTFGGGVAMLFAPSR